MYSKWVKYEFNFDKFKFCIFVEKFSFILFDKNIKSL